MNLLRASGLLAMTGILFSGLALGQSTSVTTTDQVSAQKKPSPFTLGDLSMFFGPGLAHPLTAETVSSSRAIDPVTGTTIDAYTGLSSRHFLSLGYRIDDKLSLTPVLDFNWMLSDPQNTGAKRLTLNDPYLRLTRAGIVETKVGAQEIALDGDVRYYAPLSTGSQRNGTAGAVRLTLVPGVVFGKSNLSFAALSYAKGWVQPRGAERDMPMFEVYSGPQLSYSFGKNVTAFVLYEALADWGTLGSTNSPLSSITDLEPGVDIRLNDRVTLSPYLNWFPNQSISTTSMNINADIRLL